MDVFLSLIHILRDGMIRKNYINENKIAAEDLDW